MAILSDEERRIRQKLKDDFIHYAEKCLKIRTKQGNIESFILNRAQLFAFEKMEKQLRETGMVRALILKGRQQGMSTMIGGRFYHKSTHHFGVQTFIMTHSLDATDNLFRMAKRYYEKTPDVVKPAITVSNSKELIFGILNSGYKVGTAENKNVGRSATIQYLHGSEVAFWNNASDHSKGIFQAVPDLPGTEIILESTANGVGNFFHQQWQLAEAGLSEYIAIFVPWFWQEEYTKPIDKEFILTIEEVELKEQYGLSDEQLNWRRMKINSLSVNGVDGYKSFKQEYPNCAAEAFILTGEDSYINAENVAKARKTKAEKYGPILIGVDPARFGDDRTSIIRRQGRVAYALESHVKKDTMEVTGMVVQIINKEIPDRVYIDVGGLGAGIVDRLNELGYKDLVVPVNAGSTPLDAQKYKNKRSEMWGELQSWLQDEPCQIPDSDSLHADLIGVKYKYDSNSRLVMESKEDMKKRGIRSSDEADALCLTFAEPTQLFQNKNKTKSKVQNLAKHFNQSLNSIKRNYHG